MQNYSKIISTYKSDLQYVELLVRSYRYVSYVCSQLEDETTQNIKSNVSSLTESKSAAVRLFIYVSTGTTAI